MLTIKENYSLREHNSFGLDVKARYFVEYESEEDLVKFLSETDTAGLPMFHIGSGSDLLFTKDYDGYLLHSAVRGVEVAGNDGDNAVLVVGAAEIWDDFVQWTISNGYYGLENMSLIPSEVGAAAVQNIGAYGAEAKDVIQMVEAIEIDTGKKVCFSNADCKYSYRQSKFKNEWRDKYVITYVTYRLSLTFQPNIDYGNIRERLGGYTEKVTASILRNAIIDIRRAKLPDPKVQGNGGSFFMNPIIEEEQFKKLKAKFPDLKYYEVASPDKLSYKIPAGWMIEQCGWKGKNVGPAGVHDKQALVLVNLGGAKGKDIIHLCEMIQRDVKTKFGVDIYPEVNIK